MTNYSVKQHLEDVSIRHLIVPIILLVGMAIYLYANDALFPSGYVDVQRELFMNLNAHLSNMPRLQLNLTQLGNAVIFLSVLSVSFVKKPALWKALISASVVSAIFARLLKIWFLVPRPAQAFNPESFTVLGNTLWGYHSCPSGHSITIFTTLTVLMFAFMPYRRSEKITWYIFTMVVGLFIALSRVAVGAHHPLDVVIGCVVGYMSGVIGICIINRHKKLLAWIENKRFYPLFIAIFLGFGVSIVITMIDMPLFIYIVSLINLIIALYVITKTYITEVIQH